VQPGTNNVAIGSRLAELLGVGIGSEISLLIPEGRTTPFGTLPRIVASPSPRPSRSACTISTRPM
jgi:lipoprotein-releasing system permease protein